GFGAGASLGHPLGIVMRTFSKLLRGKLLRGTCAIATSGALVLANFAAIAEELPPGGAPPLPPAAQEPLPPGAQPGGRDRNSLHKLRRSASAKVNWKSCWRLLRSIRTIWWRRY